jgi:hypothetical protein
MSDPETLADRVQDGDVRLHELEEYADHDIVDLPDLNEVCDHQILFAEEHRNTDGIVGSVSKERWWLRVSRLHLDRYVSRIHH